MYKVGIIGIGPIAEGYGKPDDPLSYCHAGGILYSDRVELTAVADLLEEKRETLHEKWGDSFPGLHYHDNSAAMLQEEELDIVAVCVRGPHHFAVASQVIETGPKAIFLEKPPTCSLAEMDALTAAAKAKNIPITVSYSRHWAPHILRLQELVQEGLIGEVKTVIGYVGHSVLSFAGHGTDLICQFAGYCPRSVMAHGRVGGGTPPDGYEPEPALDNIAIEFDNGVVGLQVGGKADYDSFYADVFGSEGRVRIGMYFPPSAWDGKGTPIDLSAHAMPGDKSVFTVAYAQIADHLDGGPLPHCTDDAWMIVHELGFAAIESICTGQRIEIPNSNRERKVFANG